MADDELDAIRARRMAELQQQGGGGGMPPGMMGGGMGGGEGAKAQAEQHAKQEEMKNMILGNALEQGARTRLNTIAVAKPDKAKMIENLIIQMFRQGNFQGSKLSEQGLIGLLEQVSSSTQKKTTVKFDRRRVNLDSDDDS